MTSFHHAYFDDSFTKYELKNPHEVYSSEDFVLMDSISHDPISTKHSSTSLQPNLYQKLLYFLPLSESFFNIETHKVVIRDKPMINIK